MVPARKGAPLLDRLMARCIPEPNSGCYLWEGSMAGRYGIAFLTGTKVVGAHRAMMIAHGHNIPPGAVVMHRCDNPLCVNIDHLSVGTQADNMDDMKAKGRHRPAHAVATEWRQKIRDDNTPNWALAMWFGVSVKTIRNIRSEA